MAAIFLKMFNTSLTFEQHVRYILSKTGIAAARTALASYHVPTATNKSVRLLLTAALMSTHPSNLVEPDDALGQRCVRSARTLWRDGGGGGETFAQRFGAFVLVLHEWKQQDIPQTMEGLRTALDCYRVERETHLNHGQDEGVRDVDRRTMNVVRSLRLLGERVYLRSKKN